ncbi:GlxA family transcriptional regulator [Kitasatospora sp. NPDC018619]|uniref:GlxA family transcriptional regulator n=1 Tax=unclassified Kitasatospora TaxID=2633591 RepID=UPI00378A8D94
MTNRSLLIVLSDHVELLDVTGPMTVFDWANRLCAPGRRPPAYRLRTASPGGRPVTARGGLVLGAQSALAKEPAPDTVVVPGVPHDPDVAAWLKEHAPGIRRIVSTGGGAFVLGAAGLLDGRRAVAHWRLAPALARRFPAARVDSGPVYGGDGQVWTSAGMTSGIDLALALVEADHGPELALEVARQLVVLLRRGHHQRQISTQLRPAQPERGGLRQVLEWIVDHPDEDLTVGSLAWRAALSPRQFTRAFTAETGVPPGRFVARVRLQAARRKLVEDPRAGLEEVARSAGYSSAEVMRRAFRRAYGMTPTAYRRADGQLRRQRWGSDPVAVAGREGGVEPVGGSQAAHEGGDVAAVGPQ